jgi:tRNA threonylcarbamoyl adenosine modification protein YeaZ
MIQSVLCEARWEREQITCVAVGLGPGSYTGIRTAIAIAQGWQLAADVRLAGVSSIEALAAQAQAEGITGAIDVVVDAQRREFYCASFELTPTDWRMTEPLRLVSESAVQQNANASRVLLGPEVTRWFPAGRLLFPRASMAARLAGQRHQFAPPQQLEPIYLRATTFVKAAPPRTPPA